MTKFADTHLITLKDNKWLENQRVAGRCVSTVLNWFIKTVEDKPAKLSLLDLEAGAKQKISELSGATPTFLGYRGFPGAVCLSVNKQLVHGIPSDYILTDGDIVTMDLGVTYHGAIADAAYSCIYGEPRFQEHARLLEECRRALGLAIETVKIGSRLGAIGHTISRHAAQCGFNVIVDYGGHGLDENKPHAEPFVPNRARQNDGVRIQRGMTIAIEPMFVIGDTKTKISDDGWTVMTEGMGCHFEHTLFVDDHKTHIITEL